MSTVAVIAHDAGGAEILSSWARRSGETCVLVAEGPAKAIFARKCPELVPVSLEEAVAAADWLLCGSGWQVSLEREAIRAGRLAGKKTVTFLDHWVNYLPRFQDGEELILPDEIWVGDADAFRIALETFPGRRVLLKENPYFLDLKDEIASVKAQTTPKGTGTILYVCEPIADHALLQHGDARYFGYTEHDALAFFLEYISLLDDGGRTIVVRPHPAEKSDKYAAAIERSGLAILSGGDETLLRETLAADIVVGCESMAMVVGLLAGKRVVSSIPPGGRQCQLPHGGIEHLAAMKMSTL